MRLPNCCAAHGRAWIAWSRPASCQSSWWHGAIASAPTESGARWSNASSKPAKGTKRDEAVTDNHCATHWTMNNRNADEWLSKWQSRLVVDRCRKCDGPIGPKDMVYRIRQSKRTAFGGLSNPIIE